MTPDLSGMQVALEGDTDVIVRRSFSHPPAKVWRALTEPDLIRQWMATSGYPMTRCEIDPRAGGSFHYAWAGPEGQGFFFSGPVLKADPPHHMTHVEHFNGDTVMAATITTDLVAEGTGTRMTMVMRYADAAARQMAVETGMTDGMAEVYARLEALPLSG